MQNLFRNRSVAPFAAAMLIFLPLVGCGGSTDSGEAASSATTPAEGSAEEFNIPDEPDSFGGTVLKEEDASANETSAIEANIRVNSQSPVQGVINIASAGVPETGWVVVHADSPEGEILGYTELLGPLNPTLTVEIGDAVAAGSQLWAGVYQDLGEAGKFEPGTDEPFMKGNEPVGAAFTIE